MAKKTEDIVVVSIGFCPRCGDIIASLYRHDYQTCKCGKSSIDGGQDYCKIGGKTIPFNLEMGFYDFDNLRDARLRGFEEGLDKLKDEINTTSRTAEYKTATTSILEEAQELVYGNRHESYGDFVENMTNTANIVNAVLGTNFKGSDIAMVLVCVKLAREKNTYKRDNCTDSCGYLDGYSRCKEKESPEKLA